MVNLPLGPAREAAYSSGYYPAVSGEKEDSYGLAYEG